VPDPSDTASCYNSFTCFRARATQPYQTTRLPGRPFRPPPGPSNTCHICQAPDHFARECPSRPQRDPPRPTRAHLADDFFPASDLPDFRPPSPRDADDHPHATATDAAFHIPVSHV